MRFFELQKKILLTKGTTTLTPLSRNSLTLVSIYCGNYGYNFALDRTHIHLARTQYLNIQDITLELKVAHDDNVDDLVNRCLATPSYTTFISISNDLQLIRAYECILLERSTVLAVGDYCLTTRLKFQPNYIIDGEPN